MRQDDKIKGDFALYLVVSLTKNRAESQKASSKSQQATKALFIRKKLG